MGSVPKEGVGMDLINVVRGNHPLNGVCLNIRVFSRWVFPFTGHKTTPNMQARSPSSALLSPFFLGQDSPTKIHYRKS